MGIPNCRSQLKQDKGGSLNVLIIITVDVGFF